MRIAFHHHMGTVIESAAEIDRMLAGTPDSVGLLFDTGHLTFAGEDPADHGTSNGPIGSITSTPRMYGQQVLAQARRERWSFLDSVVAGVYTVPGDGYVDFAAALQPLHAAGYAGWMIVEAEQDPAKAHPLTYATAGYKHLRTTAEASRVRHRMTPWDARPINICMVGYGMMGVWHSDALRGWAGVVLHTVVGRRADATREFAARYGYAKWSLSLAEALADPDVDAVILATPSEGHEDQALRCLQAGKHTLIEIPIAMSLAGAERVVAAGGNRRGSSTASAIPMRARPERQALLAPASVG